VIQDFASYIRLIPDIFGVDFKRDFLVLNYKDISKTESFI